MDALCFIIASAADIVSLVVAVTNFGSSLCS
jgi:hypothetical protein